MGMYLNTAEPYFMYKSETQKPYFVDKTGILQEIIPMVEEENNFVCVTRPRRFGKTVMANMMGAFFTNSMDAEDIFGSLKIAKSQNYKRHLNQHDVIYINFSEIDDECQSYASYIGNIKCLLREDLYLAYPEVNFREEGTLSEDLKRIYQHTRKKFIFIFDEWDAVFHVPFITEEDKRSYLRFLKGLLKDKAYVSFAYMTGILPIAKYSSGSELNMFTEFTMAKSPIFSEYFGFTEQEADSLYKRYLRLCEKPVITREGLKAWYNGYCTASGNRVYNPRSVVCALRYNHLESYWTSSGPYDEIFYYIEKNIAEVREDIALMISKIPVAAKIEEYAAVSMNLSTKEEIFSAMVVYGFLSYEHGRVSIPNQELMNKFTDMLKREPSLGYVHQLAKESEKMLRATLAKDTDTMEKILEFAHNTEVPLLSYNNESDLTALVNLVYLSARDSYRIEREDKAGKGYVDFIFYPKIDRNAECIILELKVDHSAKDAIEQIKERQYILRFVPKMGEKAVYTGKILAVGIAYDRKTKKHDCIVEELA
uniref:AAA family ATPase n=1 Tax=Agathobacter sp. TaxID=2021311 RepID=UPI004057CBBC